MIHIYIYSDNNWFTIGLKNLWGWNKLIILIQQLLMGFCAPNLCSTSQKDFNFQNFCTQEGFWSLSFWYQFFVFPRGLWVSIRSYKEQPFYGSLLRKFPPATSESPFGGEGGETPPGGGRCFILTLTQSLSSIKKEIERVPAGNRTRIAWVKGQTHNH